MRRKVGEVHYHPFQGKHLGNKGRLAELGASGSPPRDTYLASVLETLKIGLLFFHSLCELCLQVRKPTFELQCFGQAGCAS